jgi:hypothetical protein
MVVTFALASPSLRLFSRRLDDMSVFNGIVDEMIHRVNSSDGVVEGLHLDEIEQGFLVIQVNRRGHDLGCSSRRCSCGGIYTPDAQIDCNSPVAS